MNNNILQQEFTIIQHNVLHWTYERAIKLSNLYNRYSPDIILLNSTSIRDNSNIKIFNYNIHIKNYLNEQHAGVAIGIKKSIPYKILDDYGDDLLGVQLDTTKGPVAIFTIYSPPRRHYLPIGDLRRALQKNIPVYILAALNAHHQITGYRYTNAKGNIIKDLIDRNLVTYLGPDFPTMVGGTTKPDAVLKNRLAFFNVSIKPGDLTSYDHIPIVMKISTKPIARDNQIRYNFKRADWDKYQSLIIANTALDNLNNITKNQIDDEVDKWMENIITVANASIPKTKVNYLVHPIDSDYLKLLMNMYVQLRNQNYWNRQQLYQLRLIQEQIRTESLRLYNEKWSEKMAKTQEIYKDPKSFWANVRLLMGSNKNGDTYLINERGEKLHTDEDKETEFQKIWRNISKITDNDNLEFDANHEQRINTYLNINEFQLEPYTTADEDRLDLQSYLTRPVTVADIKAIIRQFKNKAPGRSGINKIMLINLPKIAVEKFRSIINVTISMGYFPLPLKNGIIILILKGGKDPTDLTSYRPITLLELPAKILERIINNRFTRFCEENQLFN